MSWRHFHIEEFHCHHCGENLIDHGFVDLLDDLREAVNFPLVVSSGYRCPVYNAQVAETGFDGPHTTGHATDFEVDRYRAWRTLQVALTMPFTGIGVSQKGPKRFLHLDNLINAPGVPRPTVWSY